MKVAGWQVFLYFVWKKFFMKREVVVGLIQMSMGADARENLGKAVERIGEAAGKGAQIVCLPELFRSPYFPREEKSGMGYAEQVPGETGEALSEAAKRNKVVVVGGSVFEKDGGNFFNTSMVFSECGKLLGRYRKMHIPHDQNFFEQNYFKQGDLGYKVFKTSFGRVGVLVCYDQWFPEAARINALMGADIVFCPTAIGWVKGVEQVEGDWQEAWVTVQRGHAIANGIIVATVNRVGSEGNTTFWGGSFVCDAFGKIVAKGGLKEEVVVAEVDLEHGKDVREGWRFFYNRRPGTYKKIIEE